MYRRHISVVSRHERRPGVGERGEGVGGGGREMPDCFQAIRSQCLFIMYGRGVVNGWKSIPGLN